MPAPLKWVVENEANAIKKYTARYSVLENLEVEHCGSVINPAISWLGCSPDGILAKENVPVGCIEVKCPYSKRGITIEFTFINPYIFWYSTLLEYYLKSYHYSFTFLILQRNNPTVFREYINNH